MSEEVASKPNLGHASKDERWYPRCPGRPSRPTFRARSAPWMWLQRKSCRGILSHLSVCSCEPCGRRRRRGICNAEEDILHESTRTGQIICKGRLMIFLCDSLMMMSLGELGPDKPQEALDDSKFSGTRIRVGSGVGGCRPENMIRVSIPVPTFLFLLSTYDQR